MADTSHHTSRDTNRDSGPVAGHMTPAAEEFLPKTAMTLREARSRLSGLHFAKDALTDTEREVLYIAEALLRYIDATESP